MIRIILFASVILLLGCRKEKSNNVEFIVTSPLPQSYYVGGDSIFIQGEVKGELALHGLKIQLLNDFNDSIMFNFENTSCSAHYIFSQFYINEVTEHTDVRLEIQVKIDEAGTLAKKTIPIHLYP
jgi:hypothetical protein